MEEFTYGELFKFYRLRAGLEQREVADELGVHHNTISHWESHKHRPRRSKILLVREIFRLSTKETNRLLKAADYALEYDAPHQTNDGNLEIQGMANQSIIIDKFELPNVEELAPLGLLPAGSRLPFRHNPLFTGRQQNLLDLAKGFLSKEGKSEKVVPVAIVTGSGGIGKTQLAIEFAYHYGRYFSGGVFWLNFADATTVPNEIIDCGCRDALNLPQFDDLKRPVQIQLVQRQWQDPISRLLIFDNCEDEELLVKWLPTSGGCHVLVTSRRESWSVALGAKIYSLNILNRFESINLLKQLVPNISQVSAESIALELGDFPLALHLAGSFLARYSDYLSPYDYLVQLQDDTLLSHPSLEGHGSKYSPTGHDLSVRRTFSVSYEQLNSKFKVDKIAIAILARAAYFAPNEPVPFHLLRSSLKDEISDILFIDSLKRLGELGLIRLGERSIISMHQLIALFATEASIDGRAKADVEKSIIDATETLLQHSHIKQLREWVAHLHWVTERIVGENNKNELELCNELAAYMYIVGEHENAKIHFLRALEVAKVVEGDRHPTTASILNNLGLLFQSLGDFKEAEIYYEQALHIHQGIHGSETIELAYILHNLGFLALERKAYEQGSLYLQQSLTIKNKLLGDRHPHTARTLTNLGITLFQLKKYDKSRIHLENALSIQQKELGIEHIETAVTLGQLGNLSRLTREFYTAQHYLFQALEIQQKLLGENHSRVADAYYNIARLMQDSKKYEEAKVYYQKALFTYQKTLESDHPRIKMVQKAIRDLSTKP